MKNMPASTLGAYVNVTKRVLAALAILAVTTIAAVLPVAAEPKDKPEPAYHGEVLKFDVAESGSRFVFDEAPVFDDGLPAYGNAFVTAGYIFPYGYLDENEGVDKDGKPVNPRDVIGRWNCRGWFVGNGAKTTSGPWVVTTQLYDLAATPGAKTLVTDGLELADEGVTGTRAVTGGTGPYQLARGQARQTLLGYNTSEGVNLRFAISVVTSKR